MSLFLKGLSEVSEKIVVVANEPLTEEAKEKLLLVSDEVIVRPNTGFDVWAYKDALEYIGYENLNEYDELVLSNFTCYGPIYPFSEMFEHMSHKECDFWGAVKHPDQPNHLLPNKIGYIYEHIMSYFMVVRRRMLVSEEFVNYWKNVPEINSKTESTALHETVFTRHFEQKGFVSDSFVDLAKYQGRCYNSSILLANELLIVDRCPLVKRRAFFFPPYDNLIEISDSRQARELISFINNRTDYNASLIWDDLLKTQDVATLRRNMNLCRVVSDVVHLGSNAHKVGVLVSVASDYVSARLIDIAAMLPAGSVMCVAVPIGMDFSEDKNVFADLGVQLNIKPVENVDCLSANIRAFNDVLGGLEAFCCIAPDYGAKALSVTAEDYLNYHLSNLLNNKAYVTQIVNWMAADDNLGFVCPPPPNFGPYYLDEISDDVAQRLYKRLSFRVPHSNRNNISFGGGFWMKPKAARRLFTEDFSDVNAREMAEFYPVFAQEEGYYPSWIMSEDSAAVYIGTERYAQNRMSLLLSNGVPKNQKYSLSGALRLLSECVHRPMAASNESKISSFDHFMRAGKSLLIHKIKTLLMGGEHEMMYEPPMYGVASVYEIFLDDGGVCLMLLRQANTTVSSLLLDNHGNEYPPKTVMSKDELILDEHFSSLGYKMNIFYIPDNRLPNISLELYEDGKRFSLSWLAAYAYGANDVRTKYGFYSRIYKGTLYIETKMRLFNKVLRSAYSVRQKKQFLLAFFRVFRPYVIFSENLSFGDSSFELFKLALKKKKKAFFVVSEENMDKVPSELKQHFVARNSRRHGKVMLRSNKWVTSFSLRSELMPDESILKDIHYAVTPASWVFVPHGMAVGDKDPVMLHRKNWGMPTITFASTPLERDTYAKVYGFENVVTFGSPRMDKWCNAKLNDDEIFIFFTWRMGLMWRAQEGADIRQSTYFKTIVDVVTSIHKQFPERKINYTFHHDVVKSGVDVLIEAALAGMDINFIRISEPNGGGFNKAFKRSKYLVTDYSSVAYDFAYKEGAIPIYFMPDEFLEGHYPLLPAFYDIHLGVITKNLLELMNALTIERPTQEMSQRRSRFFEYLDSGNTERVFKGIFG